jgi:hypothetical protein
MGNKTHTNNKEEDVVCEHPQLNLAKKILVDNQQLLRCSLCLDRKDYNRWKDFLDFYEDQFKIFMPKDHMFSSTTLCGSAGTVEVDVSSSRFTIQTTLICYTQKLSIDSITMAISLNQNSGTYFSP